jgi:hypothetical protein
VGYQNTDSQIISNLSSSSKLCLLQGIISHKHTIAIVTTKCNVLHIEGEAYKILSQLQINLFYYCIIKLFNNALPTNKVMQQQMK